MHVPGPEDERLPFQGGDDVPSKAEAPVAVAPLDPESVRSTPPVRGRSERSLAAPTRSSRKMLTRTHGVFFFFGGGSFFYFFYTFVAFLRAVLSKHLILSCPRM